MSVTSKLRKGTEILRSRLIAPTPEEFCFLVFAVTYLCESRCVMCNIWRKYREHPEKQKEELTAGEIRDMFVRSKLLKQVRLALLAGGEPFLRRDLAEIVLFLYEINPHMSIIIPTNGQSPDVIGATLKTVSDTLTARGIQKFNLAVGIALDGMEGTHDKMRGIKGAFLRALETGERIRQINGVLWGFQFTFTPQNYGEFESVWELAKHRGVPLGFQFAQVSGHYYGNEEKQFGWTEAQRVEVRDILIRKGYFDAYAADVFDDSMQSPSWMHRILSHNVFFLDYALGYLKNQKRTFECFSGTHSCFLDPYGYVYPCIVSGRPYGNAREEPFDSLWRSPTADAIRQAISRRECHCCSFCDIPLSLRRSWRPIPGNLKHVILPARDTARR